MWLESAEVSFKFDLEGRGDLSAVCVRDQEYNIRVQKFSLHKFAGNFGLHVE